jgi:hypothetical protein
LTPQPIAIKAQAERARNLNLCFSLTRNRDQSFSQNVNLAKLFLKLFDTPNAGGYCARPRAPMTAVQPSLPGTIACTWKAIAERP